MNCRRCGEKLGFIERFLRGHFCSRECKNQFEIEDKQLTIEALSGRRSKAKPVVAPPPTASPASVVEEPEPGIGKYLPQSIPSFQVPDIKPLGFARTPPRRDRNTKELKFPESRVPRNTALQREMEFVARALWLPMAVEIPPLLDTYYPAEQLPVFMPETPRLGRDLECGLTGFVAFDSPIGNAFIPPEPIVDAVEFTPGPAIPRIVFEQPSATVLQALPLRLESWFEGLDSQTEKLFTVSVEPEPWAAQAEILPLSIPLDDLEIQEPHEAARTAPPRPHESGGTSRLRASFAAPRVDDVDAVQGSVPYAAQLRVAHGGILIQLVPNPAGLRSAVHPHPVDTAIRPACPDYGCELTPPEIALVAIRYEPDLFECNPTQLAKLQPAPPLDARSTILGVPLEAEVERPKGPLVGASRLVLAAALTLTPNRSQNMRVQPIRSPETDLPPPAIRVRASGRAA